jgi:hypothetical protein
VKEMEIVHEGKTVTIFFHDGKYYKCKPETWIKLILKELKIENLLRKEQGNENINID